VLRIDARRVILAGLASLSVVVGALSLMSTPALARKIHVYSAVYGAHVDKTTGANICTAASGDECGAGEPGPGAGQLESPQGVAVNNATGDVYIVDKGNERIDQFESNGTFVRAWGWGVADGITEAAQTCTLTCFKGISGSGAGQFASPEAIAIDNSTNPLDPSKGDVYVADASNRVVDKFTSEGAFLNRLTESAPGTPFEELGGVAIDANGELWVNQRATREIFRFSNAVTNAFVAPPLELEYRQWLEDGPGFARDNEGNFYITKNQEEAHFTVKLDSKGTTLIRSMDEEVSSGVAVDAATNNVYIDNLTSVAVFGPAPSCTSSHTCEPTAPESAFVERIGAGHLSEGSGLAIDASSGTVYVADHAADAVDVFAAVPLPGVATGAATNAHVETATLNGTVNPEGVALSECEFEYGTEASYGQSAACEEPDAAEVGSGAEAVPVHAKLAGLSPRTVYHYRLAAANANGGSAGGDRTLFTATAPLVEAESTVSVNSTEATLGAQLDAAGLATSYRVEYGTTDAYGSSTAEVDLGASHAPVNAPGHIAGLTAGTVYHFRYVATNALGTTNGKDASFTTAGSGTGVTGAETCPNRTFAGFSPTLPDCRAYELVSTDNPSEVYVPYGTVSAETFEEDIHTEFPMQAAAEGDATAYVGDPGPVGGTGHTGAGLGIEFLAIRGGDGRWHVRAVTPQATPGEAKITAFNAFASDLSSGVFIAEPIVTTYLSSIASPGGPAGCFVLYSRDNSGGYHALFTQTLSPGLCRSEAPSLVFAGGNGGTATTPSYQDLLFETPVSLTAQAPPAPEGSPGNDLYDSVGGEVHVVNVLPDGNPVPDAVFGAPPGEPAHGKVKSKPDFSNVISADGTRVFWTDLDTTVAPENPGGLTRLFVRENPSSSSATTVQLDAVQGGSGQPGGGRFWTASSDGSRVLFTDESKLTAKSTAEPGAPNLYAYDFAKVPGSRLTDLTPVSGAAVQGLVGASGDGSYVYLVADGVLAANQNSEKASAEPRVCEEAEGGQGHGIQVEEELHGHLPAGKGCNLYVLHEGEVRFIAALAAKDNNFSYNRSQAFLAVGDWQPELGFRTAQVTADGQNLVFQSTQQLTGYDNSALLEIVGQGAAPERSAEVFVYNSASGAAGTLTCASCATNGAPPVREPQSIGLGTYLQISLNPTSMRRWISADGSRVFFDSSQPLVPQDSNRIQDVYEWEREGTLGCRQATSVSGGCVFLLSGGQSGDSSFFIDADATGSNVFFTHRGQLAQVGAPEGKTDLLDARVNGGSPDVSVGCSGAGCQSAPPAPPGFTSPPSTSAVGSGNFPPGPSPKPKVLTHKQKLAKALKACRTKRNKHKRAVCKAKARKRYAPPRKASRSSKPKHLSDVGRAK
jgi:hypothetical protein